MVISMHNDPQLNSGFKRLQIYLNRVADQKTYRIKIVGDPMLRSDLQAGLTATLQAKNLHVQHFDLSHEPYGQQDALDIAAALLTALQQDQSGRVVWIEGLEVLSQTQRATLLRTLNWQRPIFENFRGFLGLWLTETLATECYWYAPDLDRWFVTLRYQS